MSLVILDNSVKKLQVFLGGAVSANECPITVSYREERKDKIGGYGGDDGVAQSATAITAGTADVDVLGVAPSNMRRIVEGFSLYNADTSSVTVTVQELVTSSVDRVICKVVLLTLQSLFYSESRGWYVLDVNGAQKTTAASEASTADSKAESAATRASVALSASTSLDTATDTAFSSGDSVTLSQATSLHVAQSANVSTATANAATADSKAVSGGLAASVVQSNETRQSTDQSTMRSLLASGSQAGF